MSSYLTTSDVANRLNVSLDTVRRWLRSGELKGSPFGRAGYRIEVADFQEFFNRRRRQTQDQKPAFPPVSSQSPGVSSKASVEEVLYVMGLELRAPLTTTQGALQQARHLLQRAHKSSLPTEAGELLAKLQDVLLRIERQVSEEMRLVSNLLDTSLIEANRIELALAWCNLVEIVRETVSRQQDLAPQRAFELELPADELVAVMADEKRIGQALAHYLHNAHRYSPPDQSIKIFLEVRGALAKVAVQDGGPGIPDGEQSSIWERFQRGQHQSTRAGSGLGLGLYITRAIIQQHRGSVGLDSNEGVGSTFWFTVPLADEM
ncbi:MAG TPA: ATP-binding protein [Ktedonobacteraceae bacterium]